jgi:hypothetical protein
VYAVRAPGGKEKNIALADGKGLDPFKPMPHKQEHFSRGAVPHFMKERRTEVARFV